MIFIIAILFLWALGFVTGGMPDPLIQILMAFGTLAIIVSFLHHSASDPSG
jgi:hypothetical protein